MADYSIIFLTFALMPLILRIDYKLMKKPIITNFSFSKTRYCTIRMKSWNIRWIIVDYEEKCVISMYPLIICYVNISHHLAVDTQNVICIRR